MDENELFDDNGDLFEDVLREIQEDYDATPLEFDNGLWNV